MKNTEMGKLAQLSQIDARHFRFLLPDQRHNQQTNLNNNSTRYSGVLRYGELGCFCCGA